MYRMTRTLAIWDRNVKMRERGELILRDSARDFDFAVTGRQWAKEILNPVDKTTSLGTVPTIGGLAT